MWWDIGPAHTWGGRYRPHGKTRAEVEKMADAREKPGEHAADKTPVFGPEDHERCHYCKGIFLKPVELHRPVHEPGSDGKETPQG